jgi:dnd system-associated protein 4
MSQVRVSDIAEDLLPFCRPWPEKRGVVCFESYAEMVVFASGLGFSLSGKKTPSTAKGFLERPNPISIEVFQKQQLFPIMLLLALAVTGDNQVARDENRVCGIVENYAEVGFKELKRILSESTHEEFHIEVGRLISNTKI